MCKAEMSRRIRQQYQAIIGGDGCDYYYPYAWWGGRQSDNNAWVAYFFYKQFGNRKGVDFHRLQNIVLKGPPELIYRWAIEIPGANLKRCQSRVMEKGTPRMLRTFALNVPGARREDLENLAVVKEVLAA